MYFVDRIKELYKDFDSKECGSLCQIYNATAIGIVLVGALVGRFNTTPLKRRLYTGLAGGNFFKTFSESFSVFCWFII